MTTHVTASSPERSAQSRRGAAHSKPGGAPILRGGRLTKVAGLVASYAPALGLPGVSLLASASALAIGAGALWGASAGVAVANSCDTNFNCTGTITQTQTLTATGTSDMSVFVDSSATINVASGVGIDMTMSGNGGIVFVARDAQSISAAGTAIQANNTSGGDVEFTITGSVSGGATTDAAGIRVTNDSSGSEVNLKVASVTGGTGIDATNSGSSFLHIDATGLVRGTDKGGIKASNSGGNLTITATSVSGATYGIQATNTGTGSLSVVASESVSGSSGAGITATSSGALSISAAGAVSGSGASGPGIYAKGSGALTITAATVSGGQHGIHVVNTGSGTLSIVATGTVSGSAGAGIHGTSSGSLSVSAGAAVSSSQTGIHAVGSGALTITAAGVAGGQGGINAANSGSGTLSIFATGTVSGSVGAGIKGTSSGSLNISAESVSGSGSGGDGIYAKGSGDVTITAATVSGSERGIQAENTGTGVLNIDASGSVTGASGAGIHAMGSGDVSISAAARVSGSGSSGTGIYAKGSGAVAVTAADVSGGKHGIDARNDGTGALSIVASGPVTGSSGAGIIATATGSGGELSISAAARVIGSGSNGDGIYAKSSDALTITAAGVSASATGIMAVAIGTAAVSVNASGSVSGASKAGIDAKGGGDLAITAAAVSGGTHGIRAVGTGADSGVTIAASGPVSSTSGAGIHAKSSGALSISASRLVSGSGSSGSGIHATSSGALTITAATVSGGGHGIYAKSSGAGALSISAAGSVSGSSGAGISATSEGTGGVNVTASGAVAGSGGDAISVTSSGGDVSVDAKGAVTSIVGDNKGISATNTGTGNLTITADGSVSASGIGIEATSTGTATITARSAVTSSDFHGISVTNSGASDATLTVSAGGSGAITGGMAGIRASASGSGDITLEVGRNVTGSGSRPKYGAISASASGGGKITIRSTATLTGRKHGIYAEMSGGSDLDIELSSGASVVAGIESGAAITGGEHGIMAKSADRSASEIDIYIKSGASVRATKAGVRVEHNGTGTATISADGSVAGGMDGITSSGSGNVTITVSGMVKGGTATQHAAIRIAGGGMTSVTIMSGAVVGVEGSAAAIYGTGNGVSYVAVKPGATLEGKIDLGDGDDTLVLNRGEFAEVKGGDDTDELRFESGESSVKKALEGWETIKVLNGATAKIAGGVKKNDTVKNMEIAGTLDLSGDASEHNNSAGFSSITVSETFTGGGTIVIDANFADGDGKADMLNLSGVKPTGRTLIVVNKIGGDHNNKIVVVTVPADTRPDAFRVENPNFKLTEPGHPNNTYKDKFILEQVLSNCTPKASPTGVYTCSGVITTKQELSASSVTLMSVTLMSEAEARLAEGSPFNLIQSGNGGILFSQQSPGGEITTSAGQYGISAENGSGGSVTISATGEIKVTAASESGAKKKIAGISVDNDDSGLDVSVTASGSIEAARHADDNDDMVYGIRVSNSGSGTTVVAASGSVTSGGSLGDGAGIYVTAGNAGTGLTVSAASVQGGASGIKAMNAGTGMVAVTATGSVTATGDGSGSAGIHVTSMSGAGLTVSAGHDVTSEKGHGIYARLGSGNSGSGKLEITAAKSVVAGAVDAQGMASGGLDGIRALGSANAGSLKITLESAASVNATQTGIHAQGSGAGGVELNVGGSVRGGVSGIVASNTGTGTLKINVSGSVSAMDGTGHGIMATSSGGIDIDLSSTSSIDSSGVAMEISGSGDAAIVVSAHRLNGAAAGLKVMSGSGKVDVRAGTVRATTRATTAKAIEITQNGNGGVVLRLDSATSNWADAVVVKNDSDNAGATYLKIDGEVRGSGGDAIKVTSKDNDVTIKVNDAHAAKSGVRVTSTGTGAIAIESRGLIATRSAAHATDAGILVETGRYESRERTIVAESVTIAAKDVEGDYAKGIHVKVNDDRHTLDAGTDVSIRVSGKVTGSSHGSDNGAIRVRNRGETTITLESGARVGAFGSPPRDNADAINTIVVPSDHRQLGSGAAGADTVTVNTGASVVGNIRLGSAEDTLIFDGGDFSDADVLDGGGNCGDALVRVEGWCIGGYRESGAPWEQKPYNDKLEFRNLTGSFPASEPAQERLLNWEVITFGPGAEVRFDGEQIVATARNNNEKAVAYNDNQSISLIQNRIVLDSGAVLRLDDDDPDDKLTLRTTLVKAADRVEIDGELDLRGVVRIDASFDSTTTIGTVSDVLHLESNLTDDSEVAIRINNLGWSELATDAVMVATVARDVDASKIDIIGNSYRLVPQDDPTEIWVRQVSSIVPSCEESRTGSGVFYCSGNIEVSTGQVLPRGATGVLRVTLQRDSSVTARNQGSAFDLRGGDSGVIFTQDAPKGGRVQRISGFESGIKAAATGDGNIDVTVTGSVTGGRDAAIHTTAPAGNDVTVMLNSGATVGAAADRQAITDSVGNATVTVNAGARIVGTVDLGAGDDTLIFDGGDFDKNSRLVGSGGTGDRIEFRSGVFKGVKAERLQQWETIAVSGSATVGVTGGRGRTTENTFDANLDLASGAVLSMADNGAAEDVVTVTGNLSSERGIVKIDVDFASQRADRLVVSGSASGTTMIDVSIIGRSLSYQIEVARVSGEVRANAFALKTPGAYDLQMRDDGSFWLGLFGVPAIAGCLSQGSRGSGVYACSGAIQTSQSLTADHGATMNVTVADGTHVNVTRGNGFDLHQRGSGGIHFTQSGGVIEAFNNGIFAKNDGRGPVELTVLGEVRGGAGSDHAAIKTDSTGGGAMRITLGSGADVGRRGANAVIDSGGDATVMAMAGSRIAGDVELGGGADALVIDGGDVAGVTRMDGGDGIDTLRFAKGSGSLHADLVSRGLENWESVVVGSGFALSGNVRLAPSSDNLVFDGASLAGLVRLDGGGGNQNALRFMNASGSLKTSNLVGWERIEIGQGADIALGSGTLDTGRLAVSGRMSLQNASADDELMIEGDFEGGGTVALDAKFAANGGGTADMLKVKGDLAGRATTLQVRNLDPVESAPTDGSVALVSVDDRAGVDPAAFRIADGGVPAGAFAYTLAFRPNGLEGGEFYLENAGKVSDTGAILEAGPSILASGFAKAPTFASRNAARSPAAPAASGLSELQDLSGRKAWIRIYSEEIEHGTSANGGKSESSNYGVQVGLDVMTIEGGYGDWNIGVTSQFGTMEAEATAPGGRGTLSASGQGLGAVATWRGGPGAYFDGQFQMNWISSEYASTSAGTFVTDSDTTAWVASVESGMRFGLGGAFSAVPQAQLAWGAVQGDSFTTDGGLSVDFGDQANLTARVGAALEMAVGGGSGYLSADIISSPGDPADVDVTGGTIASELSSTWVEVGFGFSVAASEASHIYLDGSYREGVREGMDDESAVSVSSGIRFSW